MGQTDIGPAKAQRQQDPFFCFGGKVAYKESRLNKVYRPLPTAFAVWYDVRTRYTARTESFVAQAAFLFYFFRYT